MPWAAGDLQGSTGGVRTLAHGVLAQVTGYWRGDIESDPVIGDGQHEIRLAPDNTSASRHVLIAFGLTV